MLQSLTDHELLDVPLGSLVRGKLARSFKVHAAHAQKAQEAEVLHVNNQLARNAVEERHEEEELHQREEIVLARLAEREMQLREEAEHLDVRALKLEDGRRAYVDGDDFRDAEGHNLTRADRARAEVLHVEQPQAATWQEMHDLDNRILAAQKMRHDVEDLQAGNAGASEAALLSRYEQQIQIGAATAGVRESAPADYSDTDYMGTIGGLTSAPLAKGGPRALT